MFQALLSEQYITRYKKKKSLGIASDQVHENLTTFTACSALARCIFVFIIFDIQPEGKLVFKTLAFQICDTGELCIR